MLHKMILIIYAYFQDLCYIILYGSILSGLSVTQALEVCMTTMVATLAMENYGRKFSPECSKLFVRDRNSHDNLCFDLLSKKRHQVNRFHIQINTAYSTDYFYSRRVTVENCKVMVLKEM